MRLPLGYFDTNPLIKIMLLALAVRLVAVFCAPGYMMHDDHFLTVEPASSWAVGQNFNDWIPTAENKRKSPEPISFLYPGALMGVFKVMHSIGIHDPYDQMTIMRFLHALYSLLTVWLVFKITEKWSNRNNAIQAALLMAFLAILPNFSVRNLVELVCMPPLMAGYWWLIVAHERAGNQKTELLNQSRFWMASAIMGLAVGIRFQLGLAIALTGVILFFQNGWRTFLAFGVTSFFVFFCTQLDDMLLWGGKPFQHLFGYFAYNKEHALHYPGSPFTYLSFIFLFVLPPVSLFLLRGYIVVWRRYILLSLPMLAFIVFHLFYPNRQERFILPALPAFIILGVIGWNLFVQKSAYWTKHPVLLKRLYIVFVVLNSLGLIVLATTFSKQARVLSMSYLYEQGDCRNYVLEFTHQEGGAMMPQHYAGIWTKFYYWNNKTNVEQVIAKFPEIEKLFNARAMPKPVPNYYLFYDGANLSDRVQRVSELVDGLTYCTTIESGWFDKLLHTLNDKNTIEKIHIYRVAQP